MKCSATTPGGLECGLEADHAGSHNLAPAEPAVPTGLLDRLNARHDALLEAHRELEARVTALEATTVVAPMLPRDHSAAAMLELPADALPAIAPAPLHGALSLVPGATVVVSLKVGGFFVGTYVGEDPKGLRADLGERAGVMTVPADRVLPAPESWR